MIVSIARENARETLAEIMPLYLAHYEEMRARLAEIGVNYGDVAPDLNRYLRFSDAGALIHLVARADGEAVGYANAFIGPNMHNGEIEACEDAVFALPAHRRGIGRRLYLALIEAARDAGVKRLKAGSTTDPRAAMLMERMGFRPVAVLLSYEYGGADVRS